VPGQGVVVEGVKRGKYIRPHAARNIKNGAKNGRLSALIYLKMTEKAVFYSKVPNTVR
jgi:hypothetical protein